MSAPSEHAHQQASSADVFSRCFFIGQAVLAFQPTTEGGRVKRAILLAAAFAAAVAIPAHAQETTGSLMVSVKNRASGEALPGAQVSIVGTSRGGITNEQGRFAIPAINPGTYAVKVQFLGFSEVTQQNVVIRAGAPTNVDINLEQSVLSLQELVVTGVTDPTAGVKLPFTVSKVGSEQLQVASTSSPLEMLSGKVAGAYISRQGGKPGADVEIQLRSPTAFEGSNRPLFVVDGIVVATENMGSPLSDIDPSEIENIEVIKGAAAASLYGSRAAAGVVSITTNRGQNMERGTTRITSRLEYGKSVIAKQMAVTNAHQFRMNADGTSLVNSAGEPVGWAARSNDPSVRRMAVYNYPGQIYDNVAALYNPGEYLANSVSFSQASDNTTVLLNLTRRFDEGALIGNRGREAYTGRVTVDHRLGDKLLLSLTGSHSDTWDDVESGNPYQSIMTYPAYVNLLRKDAEGKYLMVPDSSVEVENPIWRQTSRDNYNSRVRTLASINTRYSVTRWATLDAQLSYDRADTKEQVYVPKGTPTSATTDAPSNGSLELYHQENNAANGSLGATLRRQFGDLNARLTGRGSFETEWREAFGAIGEDFIVKGVRDLSAARAADDWYSNTVNIKSNSLLGDLGLDYKDRYITSFLIRHDGSSLFGPQNRWHTYKRASAKWRISEEEFFDVPFINELGIRYAMGEAGGRPGFTDQYEQWNISRTSGLTRETAGNPLLKPSFTREQEVGIDFIGFNNRVQLELVYARQLSKDQVIIVPATVATGYSSLRANAGEMIGQTVEATLQWNALRGRNFTLSFNGTADHTDTELTEWDRSCFFTSNTSREHEYTCAGEKMGQFWIHEFIDSKDELPHWLQSRADEFDINDDGYLVWVGKNPTTGEPYTWRDGLKVSQASECPAGTSGGCGWGSSTTAGGFTYRWGEPFLKRDSIGDLTYHDLGSSLPDVNFGFGTNMRYKNISAYAGFRGQLGGKIYNRARNWGYANLRHADFDMRNVPDELKKTQDYFSRALAQDDTCNSMACGSYYSEFLEDATYLKLSELRVSYRFGQEFLRRYLRNVAPSDLSIGVNATELFTLSGYSGNDPSSGVPLSRVEILRYPNLRTLRLTVDVNF
jgi:TonB-linked SusC/RagA family outer membrane protein